MLKKVLFYGALVLFSFVFLLVQYQCGGNQPEKKEMTKEEMIERGAYLVTAGGCHDCHSPKVYGPMGPMPDTTRLLSGQPANEPIAKVPVEYLGPGKWAGITNGHFSAWAGPWGVTFARNLTPDEPTGIGLWTEDIFIKAMRTGKQMGTGRDILPPMPWFNLAKMTDEDLKSIFAYLKSLPPVHNQVPDPIPPDKLAGIK
jgi:mono/diheme cytochrome c family protein